MIIFRWRELARRVPNNYFIVRDLDQGTDYRFRVRAETREGLLSEPSPATSIFRTLGKEQSDHGKQGFRFCHGNALLLFK